jgi:hypothetical protein
MVRKRAGVPGGGVNVFDREMLSPNIKAIADLAEGAKFTFETKAMQNLWDLLVTGQITDGIWENSKGRVPSLFWAWMSTGTGGSTSIRGEGPNALRTNYPLRKEILKWSGKDALKIVQKTEPDATLEDVGDYLDEIARAMKKVKKVKIRAPEMEDAGSASDMDKMRHELKWKLGLSNPKVEWEKLLEGTGSRSGQYHFFAVYFDPETEEYVGANAYGRFGKSPKSVQIARGPVLKKVEGKVNTKMRAKERKGYYPSKGRLAMQRKAREFKFTKSDYKALVEGLVHQGAGEWQDDLEPLDEMAWDGWGGLKDFLYGSREAWMYSLAHDEFDKPFGGKERVNNLEVLFKMSNLLGLRLPEPDYDDEDEPWNAYDFDKMFEAVDARLDNDMAAYGKRWFKKNIGGRMAMQRMARRVASRFVQAATDWDAKEIVELWEEGRSEAEDPKWRGKAIYRLKGGGEVEIPQEGSILYMFSVGWWYREDIEGDPDQREFERMLKGIMSKLDLEMSDSEQDNLYGEIPYKYSPDTPEDARDDSYVFATQASDSRLERVVAGDDYFDVYVRVPLDIEVEDYS